MRDGVGMIPPGETTTRQVTADSAMETRQAEGSRMRVVILVQNLPVPFDRRVWQEALALTAAGYEVHVICPRTDEFPERREYLNGIHIYRYSPGPEARRAVAYLSEYAIAILAMLR